MKVTIYGASDDLVEVEGDLSNEFNGDDVTLIFGDGTHVRAEYGRSGLWRLNRTQAGSAAYEHVFTATDSDSDAYSDRVTLDGNLVSVDKERTHEERIEMLTDAEWRRLSEDDVRRVFDIAKKGGAL